jgi:hypothetical protein
MAKEKKKVITESVSDVSPYELELTLGDLYNRIAEWIQEHGADARLDWDAHFYYDYDPNPSPRFNIKKDRQETDAEFSTRIALEKKRLAEQEERERQELERLQAKFGKK